MGRAMEHCTPCGAFLCWRLGHLSLERLGGETVQSARSHRPLNWAPYVPSSAAEPKLTFNNGRPVCRRSRLGRNHSLMRTPRWCGGVLRCSVARHGCGSFTCSPSRRRLRWTCRSGRGVRRWTHPRSNGGHRANDGRRRGDRGAAASGNGRRSRRGGPAHPSRSCRRAGTGCCTALAPLSSGSGGAYSPPRPSVCGDYIAPA